MTREEASRIAEHAFEWSAFPHEQVLAVLIAFGLVTIDEPAADLDETAPSEHS